MTMDRLPDGDITLPHAVSKPLNEPSPFSTRTVPPVTRNALSANKGPSKPVPIPQAPFAPVACT